MGLGFAYLAMVIGSAIVLAVGWMGLVEKLPRNAIAGVRTPYSMRNDDNWREVHRASGPYMVLASAAVLAASLSFLPFVFLGKIPDGLAVGMLLGQAGFIVIAVVLAAVIGTSKAKKVLGN